MDDLAAKIPKDGGREPFWTNTDLPTISVGFVRLWFSIEGKVSIDTFPFDFRTLRYGLP